MSNCKTCDKPLNRNTKSGYCAKHIQQTPEHRARMSEISKKALADPAARENMRVGARRRFSDPAEREAQARRTRMMHMVDPTIRERQSATAKRNAADPEWLARNSEKARKHRIWEKGTAARTSETHAKQGRTFSQRHGIASWCPPDYVEVARQLRRKHIPLDEVKQMIAEQEAADLERFRRSLDKQTAHE